jgi:hypothetical protein
MVFERMLCFMLAPVQLLKLEAHARHARAALKWQHVHWSKPADGNSAEDCKSGKELLRAACLQRFFTIPRQPREKRARVRFFATTIG